MLAISNFPVWCAVDITMKEDGNVTTYSVAGKEVARKLFDDNGKLIKMTGVIPDGTVKQMKNGKLYSVECRKGKCDGKTKVYTTEGRLQFEESTNVNGVKESLFYDYHPSGKLKSIMQSENGKISYLSSYYETGDISGEHCYFGGKNGTVTHKTYYPGKILHREFTTKKGKINGILKAYYTNGKLSSRVRVMNGKLSGTSLLYYETGRISAEETYTTNKIIYKKEYEPDGRIRIEGRTDCKTAENKTEHCFYIAGHRPITTFSLPLLP